jgi:dienelactone hydrolase
MEEVRFERWSLAGPHGDVPAWFLLPERAAAPLPAVVALHPHGRQFELGKSLVAGLVGNPSRAYALAAARAGFAVLAPDMLGFEDHRPPAAERKGSYALQGDNYERLLAAEAVVRGESLQGWMLAELSLCASALQAEPRVDGSRLALLGQSYGGQQSIFGMVADPRFRAAIVSCGFSLVRLLVERHISHNLALYVPGLLPDLDFDALVPSLAPRALTVIAGRRDAIFPVEGVELVEASARRAWKEAGAPAAVRFRYFDGPHDLPADALAEALVWLGSVLRAGVGPSGP